MKIILLLLFFSVTITFAQDSFVKTYALMTDAGTKLFNKPLIVTAKTATPLKLPSEAKWTNEVVDTLYSNETALLIKMIGKEPDSWVVKYKTRYRIMTFNEDLFFFDEELYKKVVLKESIEVDKKRAETAKKFEEATKKMGELVEKMQAMVEADKKKYATEIEFGKVKIGMPPHVVIASWGEPERKVTSTKASGTFMIWYYTDRSSSITFYDGKVYEITTSN